MAESSLGQAGEGVSAAAARTQEQLASAGEAIRDSASDAYREMRSKMRGAAEDQIHRAAKGLEGIARSIDQMAGNLERDHRDLVAQYAHVAAEQINRAAHAIDRRNMDEITSEVEAFAQRQPAVFIGGAFAAGFLLARFLKSSRSGAGAMASSRSRRSGAVRSGYAEYEPPLSPTAASGTFTTKPTNVPGAQRLDSES